MPRRLPQLTELYDSLLASLGPQHWWPAESPLEVVVGAVLVQNTAWRNVERAIANLKTHQLLDMNLLSRLPTEQMELLIQPAGYFRVKTKRLKNLLQFLLDQHTGSLDNLFAVGVDEAREQLLSVNGVGPETADSILLYAGGLPKFVVDAYTRRILLRHDWINPPATYDSMQQLFERRLTPDVEVFNEFHALIVRVGHEFCRAKPKCEGCPLECYLPRGGPCEI